MSGLKEKIIDIAIKAKIASRSLYNISSAEKNKAILAIADTLKAKSRNIFSANKKDIVNAEKNGLSSSFIDRLAITKERLAELVNSFADVADLPDPVGKIMREWSRPNGLLIKKVRVPIGVIGIIYESRPNVTGECAVLCLKSGNACILRGGSEAINTNLTIYALMADALKKRGLPKSSISMIPFTDRQAVDYMLNLSDYIDLIIPRGGESLIRKIVAKSKIPVIKHYKGVCHIYVDKYAKLKTAVNVALNAKVQRPATCNAMETLLVHKDIAQEFLPVMLKEFQEYNVEVRGCRKTIKIAEGSRLKAQIKIANEKDYYTEYLDLIVSVKIVQGIEEAIEHIEKYGTRHSDGIITENKENAKIFTQYVDSACVYVNASTRFTDGYQFGLGAEIGISTDKIHARGPMALEELTSYKYIVYGNGQIRA